jgi:deazaflavin-dependent oxidoreductase (nitroreductase family)
VNVAKRSYSRFQSMVQKFASTRIGAWFFAHAAHRLDKIFLKLNGGKKTLVNIVSGLPAMIMITTGAKSGLPRTLPLVYISDVDDPNRLAVIASNFGHAHNPGWYYNLKANPTAVCSIDGDTKAYHAHEAEGVEYDRFWQLASQTYFGYQVYKQRAGRRIPIMVLTPENNG